MKKILEIYRSGQKALIVITDSPKHLRLSHGEQAHSGKIFKEYKILAENLIVIISTQAGRIQIAAS